MASAIYPKGKQALLNGDIDLDTNTIKVAAVADEDYTYSTGHQYKSSVTSYAGTTDYTLSGVTITDGVLDATDGSPGYSSVAVSGTKDVDALVVYKDTGDPATSPLIAYIDLATPVRPNGGNISITWDNGASKILAL